MWKALTPGARIFFSGKGEKVHATLKQDSLPIRFFVGSVCFRNLTCLHATQRSVKLGVNIQSEQTENYSSC